MKLDFEARGFVSRLIVAANAILVIAFFPALAFSQATTEPPGDTVARYEPERVRDDRGFVVGESRIDWWNDTIFYEIFVRSFQDSDQGPLANDGIGDFRGLMSRLDYLNDGDPATSDDLGITGIWLMPIHPSPSYHGYDITDYAAVNPQYGTMEDFGALVKACHDRGIRVILDLVINHTSREHAWFQASKSPESVQREWYIWMPEDPKYRGPWNQRVWHTGKADAGFYYGLFGPEMPDLNFRNEAVTREIYSVVDFWLNGKGAGVKIDGFRLDAIRHLIENGTQQDNTTGTHQWLEAFAKHYKQTNPEAVAIGEIWASSQVAASYVGNQMDLAFDFDLARAMVESSKTGLAAPVKAAQETVLKHYPPNQYGRFLTNHDQTRVATELGNDRGKLRTTAALMLLGPGVPFLYYGEEVGQPGSKPDPQLRTPMPWDAGAKSFSLAKPWKPATKSDPGIDVASQSSESGSLLSWYRRLISLRNDHKAIQSGDYVGATASNPGIYAFMRHAEGDGSAESMLVVINLSDAAVKDVEIEVPDSPIRGELVLRMVLGGQLPKPPEIDSPGTGSAVTVKVHEMQPHEVLVFKVEPSGQ